MIQRIASLRFREPFRIGTVGQPGFVGLEGTVSYLPADVLFSAIVNGWAHLYGKAETDALVQGFHDAGSERPPFLLSSGFPVVDGIRYLPRPWAPAPGEEGWEAGEGGEAREGGPERGRSDPLLQRQDEYLKESRFVSQDCFVRLWVRREPIGTRQEWEDLAERPARKLRAAVMEAVAPAIQVDRVTAGARIFHIGEVWTKGANSPPALDDANAPSDVGLYVRLRIKDDGVRERLERVFEFLGNEGLGGDRNTGHGGFAASWEDDPGLEETQDRNPLHCALAPFSPARDERSPLRVAWSASFYQLAMRGGWVESPFSMQSLRKRTVRVFEEGSAFSTGSDLGDLRGRLLDVTPDGFSGGHRVLRYGRAFMTRIRRHLLGQRRIGG